MTTTDVPWVLRVFVQSRVYLEKRFVLNEPTLCKYSCVISINVLPY